MLSTVYLRYHYVIDVIAGMLLAVWCLSVTFWLYREHGERYPALALSGHSGSERRA
jgi:membrane-associated phospholipid phosphatase